MSFFLADHARVRFLKLLSTFRLSGDEIRDLEIFARCLRREAAEMRISGERERSLVQQRTHLRYFSGEVVVAEIQGDVER